MIKKDSAPQEQNPIQVADKIFAVIEALALEGPMGLMELSQTLNLNKTTVHRILNSLIYMGYARQDASSRYSLGFKICDLSSRILNRVDIVRLIRPYLKELVNLTGETVHLVQLEDDHAVYIDKIESTVGSIRLVSQTGKILPLYCSGVGKALLSGMTDDRIRDIWKNTTIISLTPNTIIDFPSFMEEIKGIREKGYAMDNEENETGVKCIAALLHDYSGEPGYAFSISAPVQRMNEEKIGELSRRILEVRERIENCLRS